MIKDVEARTRIKSERYKSGVKYFPMLKWRDPDYQIKRSLLDDRPFFQEPNPKDVISMFLLPILKDLKRVIIRRLFGPF